MRGIEGRVALVTGAARPQSIGRAVALRLGEAGAAVACLDIDKRPSHAPDYPMGTLSELDETVAMIEAAGGAALAVRADITDIETMTAAVASVRDVLGPISVCCAVAGGVGFGNGITPLRQLSEAEWDWNVDVNLKGTWVTVNACIDQMLESGRDGRIVTVASAAGLRGAKNFGAYAAAKAGVIALTRSYAIELGQHGITANTVAPGMIATQATDPVRSRLADHGRLDDLQHAIPIGRFGTGEDIAGAIAYLCSDDAAYVTGDILNLTGGHVMS